MSTSLSTCLRYASVRPFPRRAINSSFLAAGLSDQHQVPNVPCDRADQHIFLFHHLTYFHKLNAKAATKLIRALITNEDPTEPLFHCNETIVVTKNSPVEQRIRRSKKSSARSDDQPIYSDPFDSQAMVKKTHRNLNEFSSFLFQYQRLISPSTSLDYSRVKSRPYYPPQPSVLQMSYPHVTIEVPHTHRLDPDHFAPST